MKLVLIAGPNGAGKSTVAPRLLRGPLAVTEFVDADIIAKGLSAFDSQAAAIPAGRILVERLRQLAAQRLDFAFESTLASRTFAGWIRQLKSNGYAFHLLYLYLPGPELAVSRVEDRVRLGGHDVPEPTIRRRYESSLGNYFDLYQPLADGWWFYENAQGEAPRLIACRSLEKTGTFRETVNDGELWSEIQRLYGRE